MITRLGVDDRWDLYYANIETICNSKSKSIINVATIDQIVVSKDG